MNPIWDFRADPLVNEGDSVAQGQPLLRDRRRSEWVITAPMAGEVAQIDIGAGRRLNGLTLHAEGGGRHRFDPGPAQNDAGALRLLLQEAGLWMQFRARPFGGLPVGEGVPAAILVMATDSRPLAPDPRLALEGQEDRLRLGLAALARLTEGPVIFCQGRGPDLVPGSDRLRILHTGSLHPAGLAGMQIHRHFPASPDRPVWDISAEDVADIGALLTDGYLPETRLVAIAGPGLRESRLVRCQRGADLHAMCHALMLPGQNLILSGSALEGRESRWLGPRDRQVTVLRRPAPAKAPHWLRGALLGAARPAPVIATSAVEQAMGGRLPGVPLLRALSIGDDEAAVKLGVLSYLEEDLALVDYVTDARPRFTDLLRAALDRIEANT